MDLDLVMLHKARTSDLDSIDSRLAALRRVSILTALPEDALRRVAELLVPLEAAAEQSIFQKGDAGDSLYIVAEGRLRVHDSSLVFNELGTGDVFGEMAALDSAPRSASVTAISPCQLYRLDSAPLYRLIDEHAGVGRGIINILSLHLRARVADRARDFRYIEQVGKIIDAAQELQRGQLTPGALDEVAARGDALGDLARVFQQMAHEVYTRERRLAEQVRELRIEIDRERQLRQVSEIAASDYFQDLRARADDLRNEIAVGEDR
jgi:CRP-like cAMP-binding protein